MTKSMEGIDLWYRLVTDAGPDEVGVVVRQGGVGVVTDTALDEVGPNEVGDGARHKMRERLFVWIRECSPLQVFNENRCFLE